MDEVIHIYKPENGPYPENVVALGPLYIDTFPGQDELVKSVKVTAYCHSIAASGDMASSIPLREGIQTIRREAFKAYGWPFWPPNGFVEMMVLDGCFFMLLVLFILDHEEVKYSLDSEAYLLDFHHLVQNKGRIISSILLVGNQIPYNILRVVMAHIYFRHRIQEVKVKKSCDLLERTFYALLKIGGLTIDQTPDLGISSTSDESSNLLESLHSLILGLGPSREIGQVYKPLEPDDVPSVTGCLFSHKPTPRAALTYVQVSSYERLVSSALTLDARLKCGSPKVVCKDMLVWQRKAYITHKTSLQVANHFPD